MRRRGPGQNPVERSSPSANTEDNGLPGAATMMPLVNYRHSLQCAFQKPGYFAFELFERF